MSVVRRHAGRGHDELGALGRLAQVLAAEPDLDAQDVEDGRPLGDHVRDVPGQTP